MLTWMYAICPTTFSLPIQNRQNRFDNSKPMKSFFESISIETDYNRFSKQIFGTNSIQTQSFMSIQN
jgi:hypothetical protein